MNRRRVTGTLLTVGGILIALAALPHALLGWPALHEELGEQASPVAQQTAAIGWFFGSFSMAALGIVSLLCAAQLRRGDRTGRGPAVTVGVSYIVFGVWAMYYIGGLSPHFLAFVALGAAVAAGAWFYPDVIS